jgi:hypothetical protein
MAPLGRFSCPSSLACEHGEARPDRGRLLPEGSVKKLLDLRLRARRRFLMPGSDPSARGFHMGGECLVAEP